MSEIITNIDNSEELTFEEAFDGVIEQADVIYHYRGEGENITVSYDKFNSVHLLFNANGKFCEIGLDGSTAKLLRKYLTMLEDTVTEQQGNYE